METSASSKPGPRHRSTRHIRLEAKRNALEALEEWRADRAASEESKGDTIQ